MHKKTWGLARALVQGNGFLIKVFLIKYPHRSTEFPLIILMFVCSDVLFSIGEASLQIGKAIQPPLPSMSFRGETFSPLNYWNTSSRRFLAGVDFVAVFFPHLPLNMSTALFRPNSKDKRSRGFKFRNRKRPDWTHRNVEVRLY
jgi:hypothetical protein